MATAGVICRIRLENFMCHSSLHIELADFVNFITGQNGSGKSAILTALCVAFGCRAKGTQRASTLKDFIKTGCSYAAISVEIKNQGEDAFKPEIYGKLIILERRITESSSSLVLKDQHGRKVSHRRDDLRELVEHFNIDVENPCIIMSQDKSREFLHSGNDKDKFKFFFKATLLQQVSDLLDNIRVQLSNAESIVEELEKSIGPVVRELDELRVKIKNMEHVEEISHELDNLKKRLAWSWVYDVDKQIEEQTVKLQKLKERIPTCQERIDRNATIIEELKKELIDKKENVKSLMEKTKEVRRTQDSLQQKIAEATQERIGLEREHGRGTDVLKKMNYRLKQLQVQMHDFQAQHMQETQAQASQVEEHMRELQDEISSAYSNISRLRKEENELSEELSGILASINEITKEIEENEKKKRQINYYIHDLRQRQINKVTAFGGERVLNLLRSIERHHNKFRIPPIGPIGAHVQLDSDSWSVAVDCAFGRLLDAFIVTCHSDSLVLRDCAKEANYRNLQIIIYDFARPRLNIPAHLLPSTTHPTILSVIHSENPTVLNVLVDQGNAERQVLVQDYEVGKSVAFEQNIQNLKDVYTSDGYRMFSRGYVQTILPPNKRGRTGRLCSSLADRITEMENEAAQIEQIITESKSQKRKSDNERNNLDLKLRSLKKRRENAERHLTTKQLQLEDTKKVAAVNNCDTALDIGEVEADIMQLNEDMQQKELLLQKTNVRMTTALQKENDLRTSFKHFVDSANDEVGSLDVVERELQLAQEKLHAAEQVSFSLSPVYDAKSWWYDFCKL